MVLANMMTCIGFASFWTCSFAWLGFAILVFVGLIARKQSVDGVLSGYPINVYGCLGLGLGLYVLLITLTGAPQWALLAGLGGEALGGFGIGHFTGAGDEE